MAAISTLISAVGVAGGIAGTAVQFSAAQKEERARQRMANLEATRARRDQIRQAQAARASALASGVMQGAQGSSAVAGGMGSATSTAASNIQGINQGEQIGGIISSARSQAATGSFISSMGSMLVNNASTFGRLGEYAVGRRQIG